MNQQFHSEMHINQRELKTCSHKNLFTNVRGSMFIAAKQWRPHKCLSTDEQISVNHPCCGVLLSREKDLGGPDPCCHMGEPLEHLAERKKPDTQAHPLADSFHMRCPEQANLETEVDECYRLGGGGGGQCGE